MTTLEDAWAWYRAVADGMRRLTHLAKHWSDLPWGTGTEWVQRLERDNVLRVIETIDLTRDADRVTDEHDDLAILVLFAVFEAQVREHLKAQLASEVSQLRHPSLQKAGRDVLDDVAHVSFGRLLQAFKLTERDKDLVEQVNQIRAHRNWVAHGRRADMRPNVLIEPQAAFERLRAFLALLHRFENPPSADG
jgi:hypothetical protein